MGKMEKWNRKEYMREYYLAQKEGRMTSGQGWGYKTGYRERKDQPKSMTKVGKRTTIGDLWKFGLRHEERLKLMEAAGLTPNEEVAETIWDEVDNNLRLKMLPILARTLKGRKKASRVPPSEFCANCEIRFSDEYPQHEDTGICRQCYTGMPFSEGRQDGLHVGEFMGAIGDW